MNDQELFNLCKEVYERTGWKDTDCVWYSNAGEVHDKRSVWHRSDVFDKETNIPLFTSDYLLEKMPPQTYVKREQDSTFRAYLPYAARAVHVGDTPLKALLKLTLALHDIGELSGGRS